jgi:hypothetical protein
MKMDVNLVKHKDELLQAWQEVVDDKNPTNWALFTYEGQSYELKVAGKGGESSFKNVVPYFAIKHIMRECYCGTSYTMVFLLH